SVLTAPLPPFPTRRSSDLTFASVAAWGAGPGEMNLNRVMVVDGEREITFHKPFATAAHITADSTVLAVFDKGKDKGAVIRHQTRSEEHTSELQSPCNLVCR